MIDDRHAVSAVTVTRTPRAHTTHSLTRVADPSARSASPELEEV
jgi:hypothetical protein